MHQFHFVISFTKKKKTNKNRNEGKILLKIKDLKQLFGDTKPPFSLTQSLSQQMFLACRATCQFQLPIVISQLVIKNNNNNNKNKLNRLLHLYRACLRGGGGPQIGEVTCRGSPHLSCKRDQIKMRDYVDRRVTHQSRLPHLLGVSHLHVNRPLLQLLDSMFATPLW